MTPTGSPLRQLTGQTNGTRRSSGRRSTYVPDVTRPRSQIETFLSGLLDHVTSEYGRALPAAAEAAQQVDTSPAELRPLERPERPVIEQRSG